MIESSPARFSNNQLHRTYLNTFFRSRWKEFQTDSRFAAPQFYIVLDYINDFSIGSHGDGFGCEHFATKNADLSTVNSH
jgi:hypothetical protein